MNTKDTIKVGGTILVLLCLLGCEAAVTSNQQAPPAPVPQAPPAPVPQTLLVTVPQTLPTLTQRALQEYQKGNYGVAVVLSKQFLRQNPKAPEAGFAQYLIGEALYAQRQYEASIVAFDEVIRKYPQNPNIPTVLLKQGVAFAALKDVRNARFFLQQVEAKYPNTPAAQLAKLSREQIEQIVADRYLARFAPQAVPVSQPEAPQPTPTAPSVPDPSPASPSPGVASPPTQPQPRRALVIGNAVYPDSPLANPVNDATDVATALRRVGFETTLLPNADKPTMDRAIEDFTRGTLRGSVGLFFFAGHGVQIEGVNYLVPIGTRFSAPSDVKYHAVAADWILARMDDSEMDVKLLILGACRNNPLGRNWTRAYTRGLAVMETPKGSLIAYTTSPGKIANDGTGRNSPFTARLLRELIVPGRPIELVFKAVRVGVQQDTNGQQIPWEASSLTGEFAFAR